MDQPDFGTVEETTAKCRIDGCVVRVLGDTRCSEHGGHPQIEVDTDIWGATTWKVNPEEHNG